MVDRYKWVFDGSFELRSFCSRNLADGFADSFDNAEEEQKENQRDL